MVKVTIAIGMAAVLLAPAALAQVPLGPDAAHCAAAAANGTAALVRVRGFKDTTGNLRVQLYSDRPAEFLEKGKKLRRIELPVSGAAEMPVCVALPAAGRYTMAVLHDRDANGKLSVWNDGVGFSNNPRIKLGKPDIADVVFTARAGLTSMVVVLNYRSGFGIKPVHAG